MIDIQKTFNTALAAARFFFRSPKELAVENVAASGLKFYLKVISLPEFSEFENDAEVFLKTYGWGVARDKNTGHISALQPPAGQWVMTQGGHMQFEPRT